MQFKNSRLDQAAEYPNDTAFIKKWFLALKEVSSCLQNTIPKTGIT